MNAHESRDDSGDLLAAAEHYAALGLRVFPMHWPTSQWVCSCGCAHPKCWRRGKHPLVPRDQATTDVSTIRRWWARWPNANVGILASSLLLVDADVRNGAPPDLAALAEHWRLRPDEMVACRTGSGGYHLYFERPAVRHGRGKDRLGRGFDVQSGKRDFVVAPPSVHYSLNRYMWLPGNEPGTRPFPAASQSLLTELSGFPPPWWLLHVAPYWAADLLRLSVETRHSIRRLLRMQ